MPLFFDDGEEELSIIFIGILNGGDVVEPLNCSLKALSLSEFLLCQLPSFEEGFSDFKLYLTVSGFLPVSVCFPALL